MIGFGDFKYRERFVVPVSLAVLVSFILAAGHVHFGTVLQSSLSAEELLTLDDYVFTLSALIGGLIPLGYLWRTKDVSKSLAVAVALAWALLISGLEDVFVYLLHPDPLPMELPWLDSGIIGTWAGVIGRETVTKSVLFSWILVSGLIALLVIEFLYELEEYGL